MLWVVVMLEEIVGRGCMGVHTNDDQDNNGGGEGGWFNGGCRGGPQEEERLGMHRIAGRVQMRRSVDGDRAEGERQASSLQRLLFFWYSCLLFA